MSAWTVGLSTAIAVLAGVAFQVLGYLNLRVIATILAAVAVAALGWLAQRIKLANDRRKAWSDRTETIERALALWPLRRVKDVADRAFDLGLYPAQRESDAACESDAEIEVPLKPCEIVLIVGPPGSGKSELTLMLLRQRAADAWLIVPDGARGLGSLLSLDPPVGIAEDDSAVLLLDGCERFLPGLQLVALDDLRARCHRLFIVATIRDEELERLLRSAGEIGYLARRFVARARVVPVAGAGGQYGQAPLMTAPVSADAQPTAEAGLPPAAPPSIGRDWGVRGLAAVTLTLLGAFAAVWLAVGLKQPPPIAAQVAALRNGSDACGSRAVYAPASADAISRDRPVVMVTSDAGRCHAGTESDEVSVFVPIDGTLTEVYAFQPANADNGHYEFSCSGTMPGDPCLTNLTGTSAYAVTGAFTNSNTLASYPVEIVRAGDGFSAQPLQPVGLTGRLQRRGAATLTDGATSVTVAPTTAYSILQPLTGQPPVYVSGQVSSGSFDFPRSLKLSAWSPTAGGGQPSFDQECRPLVSGETLPVSFVSRSGDFAADLGDLLERYWTRIAKRDGESCP